ncbi:MAG: ribonuclease J [Clostridia bacterium]|nr:ribonuclease J [Clostridia bacterium]
MKKIDKIRIIPLGGLNEIGKNLTLIECGKDIIAIDCGLAFPDEEMPGVDYVIPDMQYIIKNSDRFRAIFITHGHEDHIGAIPYLLRDIKVPIYATRLTIGIIQNKLKEFNLDKEAELIEVRAGQTVDLDTLSVEFIHVNHSIADATALAVHTPCGIVLHMGDFKIDVTPVDGEMIDLTRIGQLGNEGVALLMMESTNVTRPGFTMSELKVRDSLRNIFMRAVDKRIIIATFSSNVHRVQSIINLAAEFQRKVAVSGRSMVNVIEVADQLGYMSIPDRVLVDIDDVNNYPPEKVVIITTGSQGEPMSALYRMAYSDHKIVEINNRDLVIISATAIPGNEKLVNRVVNELYRSGATVVDDSLAEVHVSGHACQEDLKLIFGLVKPKYFIPVHGEYRHLKRHEELALSLGIPKKNIVVADIGDIVEMSGDGIKKIGTVPSGKILVDGLGVGDVGNVVLRDRKHLSQDGLILIVAVVDEYTLTVMQEPEVISRGFVYAKENENIVDRIKHITVKVVEYCASEGYDEWVFNAKTRLKDEVAKYVSEQTKRKPMIIPVIKVI